MLFFQLLGARYHVGQVDLWGKEVEHSDSPVARDLTDKNRTWAALKGKPFCIYRILLIMESFLYIFSLFVMNFFGTLFGIGISHFSYPWIYYSCSGKFRTWPQIWVTDIGFACSLLERSCQILAQLFFLRSRTFFYSSVLSKRSIPDRVISDSGRIKFAQAVARELGAISAPWRVFAILKS